MIIKKLENGNFAYGHYNPDGSFSVAFECATMGELAGKVHYLNGGERVALGSDSVLLFHEIKVSE